ncbi:hypothetical protein B566_EDAN002245 [Ephemera danica]|nr:hypothetical protein B566_EDAN002245 [Ephemera danica]
MTTVETTERKLISTENSTLSDESIIQDQKEKQKRTVLVDQTNTTPSPKRANLRIQKKPNYRTMSGLSAEKPNKSPKTDEASDSDTSVNNESVLQQSVEIGTKQPPREVKRTVKKDSIMADQLEKESQPGGRLKRTTSLKENDKVNEEFEIKKRPRKVKEQELGTTKDTTQSKNNILSPPANPDKAQLGMKVSSFYGSSKRKATQPPPTSSPPTKSPKIPIYKTKTEDGSPKICVYKTNDPEKKPSSPQDRLALYEFEVDSSEEVNIKKKRKPRQVSKPKKTATRSKQTTKPSTTKKRSVSHGIKKVIPQPKPTHSPGNTSSHGSTNNDFFFKHAAYKSPVLRQKKPAVAEATKQTGVLQNIQTPTNVVANKSSAGLKLTETPIGKTAVPIIPTRTPSSHLLLGQNHNQSVSPMSRLSLNQTMEAAAYSDESYTSDFASVPILPPKANMDGSSHVPALPDTTLESLFEEDESQLNSLQAFTSNDSRMRPFRIEYDEVAQVRAQMKARKSNVVSAPMTNSLMDDKDPGEGTSSQLRQTSIRNFLPGQKQSRNSGGLFSTGALSEDPTDMACSTPQRPGTKVQAMSPLLSPVNSLPVRSSARIQAQSPTKSQGNTVSASPVRQTLRRLSLADSSPQKNTPVKSPTKRSPVKSPAKNSPVKSVAKGSPTKKQLRAKPMRLTMGTLRTVLQSNIQNEPAPPALLSPALPSDLEHEGSDPARKSYQRKQGKQVRKPTLFMEPESESGEEGSDLSDVESEVHAKTMHKTHKKPKQQDQQQAKEFEEWASKFNNELDEVEDFPLEVE